MDYRCEGANPARDVEEWAADDQVVLPRSGCFVRYGPDGRHTVDANHVLFFRRGEPYQVSHPVPGGDSCTVLIATRPVLLDVLGLLDPDAGGSPDRPFPGPYSFLDSASLLAEHHLLLGMMKSRPTDTLELEERLLVFLGEVVRGVSTASPATSERCGSGAGGVPAGLADEVTLALATHMREKITLGRLAGLVNTSPYTLCRSFKKETGVSVHRYLRRLRLLGALEELRDRPKERLIDLALDFGFSSHSHFSASFRREFRVPPSEFRAARAGFPDLEKSARLW